MNNETVGESMTDREQELPDLRALVEAAFEKAKSSGKESWNVMTVAVLKNRLLDGTERSFSEAQYGASSMSDLMHQLSDLVDLDDSVTPARVKLRGELETAERPVYPGLLVRKDLWDSIVNYSLGEPYFWSGSNAVPQGSYEGSAGAPVLPTLTPGEETVWRSEFIVKVSAPIDPDEAGLLAQWRDEHKSPKVLPSALQRRWNEDFKSRVVERLRAWFSENAIPEPEGLLVPYQRAPRHANTHLDDLRALVIRCVQNMTEEELSDLRLPPQVLLRGEQD